MQMLKAAGHLKHRVLLKEVIFIRSIPPLIFLLSQQMRSSLLFFLQVSVKAVVNIMDSTVAENDPWIQKERTVLTPNGIIFKNIAVRETSDVKDVENIIDTILLLPKPLVVHHWNTTCPESKWFRKIYYQKNHYPQQNLANHNTETF